MTTTLPKVTSDQLIDAIKAVAAENPDHVYTRPAHMSQGETCFYVHTDETDESELSPGCLVGAALHRLGVPLETLRKHEYKNARSLLLNLFPLMSYEACGFAEMVQQLQDEGVTWGEAVATARETYGF